MLTKIYNGNQSTCNFQFARTFKKDSLTESPRQTTTPSRRRARMPSTVPIQSDIPRRSSWLLDTLLCRRPSLPPMLPTTTPPPYQEFEAVNDIDMEEEGNAGNLTTTPDEWFVESATLTLNGQNISSLGLDTSTAAFDTEKYVQFMAVAGAYSGYISNALSVQDYLSNYFFLAYDTSATGQAYQSELAHTARTGSYQFKFKFNVPSLEPVTLLYFSEYEGSIIMNREGKVMKSFVV